MGKRERDRPWVVKDLKQRHAGRLRVVKRCATEGEARAWVATQPDVNRLVISGPDPAGDSKRTADRIDGYDRDDLGESPDH